MELLGAVNFNSGIALIVDVRRPVTYEHFNYRNKKGRRVELLIGDNEDGLVDVLERQVYSCGPKAFGGHPFTWIMKDGTEYTTDGWWWSGGYSEAEEMLGKKIPSFPLSPLSDLFEHYVFCSAAMLDDKKEELFKAYEQKHGDECTIYSYTLIDKAIGFVKRSEERPSDPVKLWEAVVRVANALAELKED